MMNVKELNLFLSDFKSIINNNTFFIKEEDKNNYTYYTYKLNDDISVKFLIEIDGWQDNKLYINGLQFIKSTNKNNNGGDIVIQSDDGNNINLSKLNEHIWNFSNLEYSKFEKHIENIHCPDGTSKYEGIEGEMYETYNINGVYIQLKIWTNSYGDNEEYTAFQFVKPATKVVQTFIKI